MKNIIDELIVGLSPPDDTATDMLTLGMLYQLLIYLQPKIIVEAGTWKGHFSVPAARLLPNSTIYTADTYRHGLPHINNLHFFHGDFEIMLKDLNPMVDFAFIDSGPPFVGEHERIIRWRHYEAVKPYMNKSGLIVSHDMNNRDWPHAEDILADSSLYLPGGRGITIKQIP